MTDRAGESSGQDNKLMDKLSAELGFIVFTAGGKYFCVDVNLCRAVSKPPRITPVPGAARYMAGIVNIRGEIISVLDINALPGFSSAGENTIVKKPVIIRLKQGAGTDALRADALVDIINLSPENFEPAARRLGEAETRFVKTVVVWKDQLILNLDLAGIYELIDEESNRSQ